ncbi:MAG: hypothetical protein PHE87_10110 [Victivallaceae bacterium]|nr:hypothetical protein [Victivallaceae bacterium]
MEEKKETFIVRPPQTDNTIVAAVVSGFVTGVATVIGILKIFDIFKED